MPALAAAGYYAVAPYCRGFGRTTGWDDSWDADPLPFLALNLLRDQIALISALDCRSTAMMVGHDQGSLMAGLVRYEARPWWRGTDFLRVTISTASRHILSSHPQAGWPVLCRKNTGAEYCEGRCCFGVDALRNGIARRRAAGAGVQLHQPHPRAGQCLWLHCAVGPAQAAGESGLSAHLADQRLRLLHRYALA
jgi:hypothetical protein